MVNAFASVLLHAKVKIGCVFKEPGTESVGKWLMHENVEGLLGTVEEFRNQLTDVST